MTKTSNEQGGTSGSRAFSRYFVLFSFLYFAFNFLILIYFLFTVARGGRAM